MGVRECPFCGKNVLDQLLQCTHCRETLPVAKRVESGPVRDGGRQIRHGLLYMLLAAVIGYFAGGYSSLSIPVRILPVLGTYFSPLLFLAGAGLAIHGYYLQHKTSSR